MRAQVGPRLELHRRFFVENQGMSGVNELIEVIGFRVQGLGFRVQGLGFRECPESMNSSRWVILG